ncbi:Nif11-like leader peptide family natural product precursor [Synechococcus sp. BIOS-E4-1]|uniref:Nif11-like leader peptide family natural product precursor n=1 Tax=Synechococcus sp. BIOS-E4-1 TaxID=1400864 RepID=UPI001646E6DA
MSLKQLKAFLAKAKSESSLQNELKAAKSPDEVVSIAQEHGHEFTSVKLDLLSEEELEGEAGGWNAHLSTQAFDCARGAAMTTDFSPNRRAYCFCEAFASHLGVIGSKRQ